MSIYNIFVEDHKGNQKKLSDFKGKVLLIVNTATKCGFAPQFNELQELYEKYQEVGLEILAFPSDQFANQEPGKNEEIQQVCQINYGLTFPVYAKIEVNGENAHPLFRHLRSQKKGILGDKIKWNFTKFLVDREGNVKARYAPVRNPGSLKADIEKLLKESADKNVETA